MRAPIRPGTARRLGLRQPRPNVQILDDIHQVYARYVDTPMARPLTAERAFWRQLDIASLTVEQQAAEDARICERIADLPAGTMTISPDATGSAYW